VLRFRWARGEERQQIKWVVYALVLLVATTIVAQLFFASVDSLVSPLLLLLALQGLWVAIAVAVFKYRLYGIDVLINRTLVYGTLTGLLAAIYVGSVGVLQRLLTPLINQNDQIVIEASTLAIAAPFQPLRRRVQAIIDRCFYRRYSARRTLEAFSAKLRNETDLLMLTDNLVHVVHDTLQPADVSVLLIDPKKQ
jgi:preprotein translocase subunit SecE